MTKQHQPAREADPNHHGDKTPHPTESPATTAQNLLNDAQGRWLNKGEPDAAAKLIEQGVLPAGANVLDFGKISSHLGEDKKLMDTLNSTTPVDSTAATKALNDAKANLPGAQKNLDAAQKAVDDIQNRIETRVKQDKQVQTDFDTIKKDTKSTYFYASDLKTLSEDNTKSQEVRNAAKRLLDTFHTQGRGGSNSEFATTGLTSPYIDEGSIDKKMQKDILKNNGDIADLTSKTADLTKAKTTVDGVTKDIADKQKGVTEIDEKNKKLEDDKAKTAERIKAEEDALKPDQSLGDLGKVVKGGGYYQVAERLLGLDHKAHSNQQEHELKMLTRMLQDEERKLHNGQLPKHLKQNDQLFKPENMADMLERVRKIANPDG